jgi:hypothetical protein
MKHLKVTIVLALLVLSLSPCNPPRVKASAIPTDSTTPHVTNSKPQNQEKGKGLFESETFRTLLSFCVVAVGIASLLITAILFGYKLNRIIRKVRNFREEKNKELDMVNEILNDTVNSQIKLFDFLSSQILRTLIQTTKYDEQKRSFHERYKRQMTELEYARFISFLTDDNLERVDIGIKGLDGLADPRAIPKLDDFIKEKKDKKEFSELVERAKSARDRIIHLSR